MTFESNFVREKARLSDTYRNESRELENTEVGLYNAVAALRTACDNHQRKMNMTEEITDRTFDRLNEDIATLQIERKREEDLRLDLEPDASAVRTEEMQQRTQSLSEIDLLRASLQSEEARIVMSQSELDDVSILKASLEDVHETAERRGKSLTKKRARWPGLRLSRFLRPPSSQTNILRIGGADDLRRVQSRITVRRQKVLRSRKSRGASRFSPISSLQEARVHSGHSKEKAEDTFQPVDFADSITMDYIEVTDRLRESRKKDRYSLIVMDRATQWVMSCDTRE